MIDNFSEKVNFIWSVADLLRGPYRPNQYAQVYAICGSNMMIKGKIKLVDGTSFFKKMRKSLGNKRNEVCNDQRDEITRLYRTFNEGDHIRIFDNEDFGYRRITVERPLTKIGYEINFNRYFYRYTPPRQLSEIEAELKAVEEEISGMLAEMIK